MHVRRTIAMVNGNDLDKLKAAIDSEADAVMLELEDLVPFDQKEEARADAVMALTQWDFRGKDKIVRINAPDTELGQKDLKAILPCRPDAIRLPKCESVEYIQAVDRQIRSYEEQAGWPVGSIELILVIETPLGIMRCLELCTCSRRITGVGLGAYDLTSAMGVPRDLTPGSLQLLYAKQQMIMAGKVAGLDIFDTMVICPPEQVTAMDKIVEEDTKQMKLWGFTGKSVTMLSQIPIINKVFEPDPKAVLHARKVLAGYDAAMKRGEKEIFVDGQFVDPPVLTAARNLVAMADEIERKKK